MKKIKLNQITEMNQLFRKIANMISSKQYDQALNELLLVDKLEKTEKYYELLSETLLYLKKPEIAYEILEIAKEQFSNSRVIYYKLYEVLWALKEYEQATLALAKCVRLTFDKDQRLKETEKMKKVVFSLYDIIGDSRAERIVKEGTLLLGEGDERAFPLDKNVNSWINRQLIDSKGNKHLVNLYKGYTIQSIKGDERFFLKTEIVKGSSHRYAKFNLNKDSILPISSNFEEAELEIVNADGKRFVITTEQMQNNRFNYLQLPAGDYKLKSKREFFIGKPIEHVAKKKNRLVITLYIDGLSQEFLDKNGLENLMPNTAAYFKSAYLNKNCYTTGDWTFPSVASIFTGQSTMKHKVYHPNVNIDIHKRGAMYTEKFKKAGFFTAQINNNWRITPSSGYMEGFDRIVFQNYRGGFAIAEVLGEAMEHLSSFPNNDHFLWVGIEDLHDIADGFNQDLYQQTNLTLEERLMNEMAEISVKAESTSDKVTKYKNQLKRIDLYLESFYHYLNKNYSDDDVYIAIISDHGQGYLKNSKHYLNEERRKVPFIFKGPTVPNKTSDEMMMITDYFPNMLKLIGADWELSNEVDAVILKDFGGTGRELAVTEVIHPWNPYMIAITDETSIFYLKTEQNAEDSGLLNLEKILVELVDKVSGDVITEQYPEKVNRYLEFVIERVKHFQFIE